MTLRYNAEVLRSSQLLAKPLVISKVRRNGDRTSSLWTCSFVRNFPYFLYYFTKLFKYSPSLIAEIFQHQNEIVTGPIAFDIDGRCFYGNSSTFPESFYLGKKLLIETCVAESTNFG